jgi:tetratricopeptide (TPR) repeat protein
MQNSAAQAFEDGIDLSIGLLEAYTPAAGEDWPCYPFLPLRLTGESEVRTFRTILLENPYMRVTVLPGLGGRILSIVDKRTGLDILRKHPAVEPQIGGRRGIFVREGVDLWLDGHERLNGMGNVASQIEHASEEDGAASIWLSETVSGTGLSFHLKLTLPPDAAELEVEVRVLNRWLRPQLYSGALSLYLGEGVFDGSVFYAADRNTGIGLFSKGQPFDGVSFAAGRLTFARFAEPKSMAPRQLDSWTVSLVPFSGLGGCLGASRNAALALVDGVLKVQVTQQRLNHKLLMLTEDGQTLEAPVDLYPERLLEIPLESLRPVEFVLLDPAKQEVLRVGVLNSSAGDLPGGLASEVKDGGLSLDSSREDLQRATFDINHRHLAHTLIGMKALAASQFALAGEAFEQALAYNAEDPLLWWAKAMTARIADEDNEAELLNGHFLAPLEPALRAEGYLSQAVTADPEPNRLLVPLAENPEEFIEVACLLIECGLFDQASRWLDEAIRHRDLAMLRYLTAYCLVTKTQLLAEAAQHIGVAGKMGFTPPFPFRDIEKKAIRALRAAFPDDAALALWERGLHRLAPTAPG